MTAKRTTVLIDGDLQGWAEWAGRSRAVSTSRYINALMRADRAAVLAQGGDEAERYRGYLAALGMEDEAASLDQPPVPGMLAPEEQRAEAERIDARIAEARARG